MLERRPALTSSSGTSRPSWPLREEQHPRFHLFRSRHHQHDFGACRSSVPLGLVAADATSSRPRPPSPRLVPTLAQVRAANQLDLIYKRGQAGITKASVTIVFDNSDRATSPVGFENLRQITVTRQVSSSSLVLSFSLV